MQNQISKHFFLFYILFSIFINEQKIMVKLNQITKKVISHDKTSIIRWIRKRKRPAYLVLVHKFRRILGRRRFLLALFHCPGIFIRHLRSMISLPPLCNFFFFFCNFFTPSLPGFWGF